MKEPIILKPEGMTPESGWKECEEYVKKCGGCVHEDGSVNWRAAFGADPGVCTCPRCAVMLSAWGTRIECPDCHFQFPTHWWSQYACGVHAAKMLAKKDIDKNMQNYYAKKMADNCLCQYFMHGFNNPVDDAWEEHGKIDWEAVVAASEDDA
jgi:hypothetical protein